MSKQALFIQKIYQKSNYIFAIEWNDGSLAHYRLSDLQKHCPCANCVDEITGKRLLNEQAIDENVRAVNVKNVGRYALKIQFTSGCSLGIYTLDFLRQLSTSNEIAK